MFDAFVEFEVERTVHVVGGHLGLEAEPSRSGMNRCGCSSSARTIATGRSTWDRPASSSGQLMPVA